MTGAPLRILIADDHVVFRMGLRAMLRSDPGLAIVGEAASGAATIAAFERERPDVTLLDLRMPEGGGMHALERILALDPQARVLMLSSYGAEEEVYVAMRAGACGYLIKDTDQEELTRAIRQAHEGGVYLPPRMATLLAQRAPRPDLTPREYEILQLIARGWVNRKIAGSLGMSESTVRSHTIRLFAKLDVTDRTEATTFALQRGILPF